jgi:hypothetical protein
MIIKEEKEKLSFKLKNEVNTTKNNNIRMKIYSRRKIY